MVKFLRPSLGLLGVFIVLTGIAFPLAITGIAQATMPTQANGSLVMQDGKVVGSELIGQTFSGRQYFQPRPSAAGAGYDGGNSGGTNLGPLSDKLLNGIADDPATEADETYLGVKQLAADYRALNGLDANTLVPADAVTRSASGLDPHISLRSAELQASRVALARGLSREQVLEQIPRATTPPFLGIFGEPSVNVLVLNRLLDSAMGGN